jgi:hypothetical protein
LAKKTVLVTLLLWQLFPISLVSLAFMRPSVGVKPTATMGAVVVGSMEVEVMVATFYWRR